MSIEIDELLAIMARLRDPDSGCPWDRKQTYETIIPFTIEEVYEVLDAIERHDLPDLREELGDLLFQVIFMARIAEESGAFNFADVAQTLRDKLVRRHPHVFGSARYDSDDALAAAWDGHKARERDAKRGDAPAAPPSPMDGIAQALPALLRAHKLQSRAAKVGFDWPDIAGVVAKLHEEVDELERELRPAPDLVRIEAELGDVLFSCVNVARHLRLDPEAVLRSANRRFERRFRAMEQSNAPTGRALTALSAAQWDSLWCAAKSATAASDTSGDRDDAAS